LISINASAILAAAQPVHGIRCIKQRTKQLDPPENLRLVSKVPASGPGGRAIDVSRFAQLAPFRLCKHGRRNREMGKVIRAAKIKAD
jgi:hypothetical protein